MTAAEYRKQVNALCDTARALMTAVEFAAADDNAQHARQMAAVLLSAQVMHIVATSAVRMAAKGEEDDIVAKLSAGLAEGGES